MNVIVNNPMFKNIKDIKKRNSIIAKAYKEGYSQHMIAKVLGMAQSTVHGIVKRYGQYDYVHLTPIHSLST